MSRYLHLAHRAAAAAPAARVGQPHRPQECRDGGLALPARRHAALHLARRQLAEHGRVHPAHPQAARARRPAPAKPGGDRRLVPADGAGLEPATHALPVAWQASPKAAKATRRCTRPRRLGRSYPTAAIATKWPLTRMPHPEASDPLAVPIVPLPCRLLDCPLIGECLPAFTAAPLAPSCPKTVVYWSGQGRHGSE